MDEVAFDRSLDAILSSATSSRTTLGTGGADDRPTLEARYEALVARMTDRIGRPIFTDRSDRAWIDTWFPGAARLAAWPHGDGLVFLVVEVGVRDAPIALLLGSATDEEIEVSRGYRGHASVRDVAEARTRLEAPEPPSIAWLPLPEHTFRRPTGVQPLSVGDQRRVRLIFVVIVVVGAAVVGALILGSIR